MTKPLNVVLRQVSHMGAPCIAAARSTTLPVLTPERTPPQEIDRIAVVINLVRSHLKDLKLAVAGTIIMGEHLVRPPRPYLLHACIVSRRAHRIS